MKKLIEYKLWAGQIPYFVEDPLGGVFNGGKCYGISKDTVNCYLPDTVVTLTINELSARVQASNLIKASGDMESVPMDSNDKTEFLNAWLLKHGYN